MNLPLNSPLIAPKVSDGTIKLKNARIAVSSCTNFTERQVDDADWIIGTSKIVVHDKKNYMRMRQRFV